jgi:hypothetical protein
MYYQKHKESLDPDYNSINQPYYEIIRHTLFIVFMRHLGTMLCLVYPATSLSTPCFRINLIDGTHYK